MSKPPPAADAFSVSGAASGGPGHSNGNGSNSHTTHRDHSFGQGHSHNSRPSRSWNVAAARRLAPISTAHSSRGGGSAPSPRKVLSPTSPRFKPDTSRASSVSSGSSPFSPGPGSVPPPSGVPSSARSRTAPSTGPLAGTPLGGLSASGSSNHNGSSHTYANHSGSHASGTTSGSRQQRAAAGPPNQASSQGNGGDQSLARIVIAQVFLLLSTLKDDKDRGKWEVQADQIRKVSRELMVNSYVVPRRELLSISRSRVR